MARHEPPGKDSRRLYDLPVLFEAGTLSTTSSFRFTATIYYSPAIFMAGNKIEPH